MGDVVQLTILDGNATQRSMQVFSSNGDQSGFLSPLQTMVGRDLANPSAPSNPLPVTTVPYQGTSLGYQQLTLSNTAAGFASVPAGSLYAVVVCEVADCRWRDDATNPTSSVGMPLYAGDSYTFSGDLSALRFIQVNAGSIINATFYN